MIRALTLIFLANQVLAQNSTVATDFGNMVFSNVKAYSFTLSFNSSVNDADGYVCLRSLTEIDNNFLNQYFGSANQTLPSRGSGIGHSKVFQSAAPPFFNIREVTEATTYYFAIIPYRTNGGLVSYIADSSILANVTSAAADFGSYYAVIDFNTSDVLSQLTTLLHAHTLVDYTAYRNTMVPVIFERDTSGQQKVVNCEYSGETKIYTGSFDFVALDYSREHMLARSWMPTGGATTTPEGADYHNLALNNLSDVNTLRSNYPFGEVVQTNSSYLACKFGKDALQRDVFEPRNEKKGDIARAIFYQLVCYNGMSGSWGFNHLPSFGSDQDVNVLLNWHFNDPPDAFEKAKHEYIYSLQNNRNPFIDFPELAHCIDFAEILKKASCSVGFGGYENHKLSIFPNPATDYVIIQSEHPGFVRRLAVFDLSGRELAEYHFGNEEIRQVIALDALYRGCIILRITTQNNHEYYHKIILQHHSLPK